MKVADLEVGMLLELAPGISATITHTPKPFLPRLRLVPDFIVGMPGTHFLSDVAISTMVYMGTELKQFYKKKSLERQVLIDGNIYAIMGKDFKHITPL